MDPDRPLREHLRVGMKSTILVVAPEIFETNPTLGYVVGTILALLILGYIFNKLMKPDKF